MSEQQGGYQDASALGPGEPTPRTFLLGLFGEDCHELRIGSESLFLLDAPEHSFESRFPGDPS